MKTVVNGVMEEVVGLSCEEQGIIRADMINKSRSVGQDDEPWPGRASEGNWRV